MSFPTIESQRIILRELIESDVTSLYEVYSNEKAMRHWDSMPHSDVSITLKALHRMVELWYLQQGVSWGVVIKDSQKLIGQCSLHSWNIEQKEAQLGYIINPQYWGNGYGSEVLKIIVNFGLNQLCLNTIIAEIDPNNLTSAAILEKHGFSVSEHRKNDLIVNGIYHDTNIYTLHSSYA